MGRGFGGGSRSGRDDNAGGVGGRGDGGASSSSGGGGSKGTGGGGDFQSKFGGTDKISKADIREGNRRRDRENRAQADRDKKAAEKKAKEADLSKKATEVITADLAIDDPENAGVDTFSTADAFVDAFDEGVQEGFNTQAGAELASEVVGSVTGSIGRKVTSKVGQTALGAFDAFGTSLGVEEERSAGFSEGQQQAVDTGLGLGSIGDSLARGLASVVPGGGVITSALRANELAQNPNFVESATGAAEADTSTGGGNTRPTAGITTEVDADAPAVSSVPVKINSKITSGIGIATEGLTGQFSTFGQTRKTAKAKKRVRGR